jgi:catechol 2,3-dioxygenase-like lactoylglutathione lyase family enzyme
MRLVRTCLIVADVRAMREFYRRVLGAEPNPDFPEYVEFDVGGGAIALYDARGHDQLAPGSAEAGRNRSSMVEIEVDDVDREYARLDPIVRDWVKPPTTQPWGSRSVYFRDPEGNLINFFSRPPPAA